MPEEEYRPPAPEGVGPRPQDATSPERPPLHAVLPETVAWEYRAVPLGWHEDRLLVGMVMPEEDRPAAEALQTVTGVTIEIVDLPEENFERMFASMYPDSVFVGRHLRPAAPAIPGLRDRITQLWAESPLYVLMDYFMAEWLGIILIAFLAGVCLFLSAEFLAFGILALLRLLISPPFIGLLLVSIGGIIFWRLRRRSRSRP